MDYLFRLQENVKKYLFDEFPLENTPEIERDNQSMSVCPSCRKKLEEDKVKHFAHVTGEYSNATETRFFEAGQYICTCYTKWNLQLSFNKKNYRLPVYFHNGSHYDFTFIMKLIATMPENLEVIPTTKDKEIQIEYHGIQFKDSLKLISIPLKFIVAQMFGGNLDLYVHTKIQLRNTMRNRASNGVTSTSICWHGKNSCSTVSSNRTSHWTIQPFLLASNASTTCKERWFLKTNMITWWSCGIHSISRHGVNTTNCTMYSMWLSPCITSQHHRWHIRSSWRSHLKAIMAWRHWRHCLRSGLYTSHEPIPTRGWVNSIWRRSSWITWVNFIRTRAFDWWRQARSMTSCDCWRTCVEASHKLWNSMPRSTLTTSSNQLLSVKAFIISMPTICIVEPCIEWCLTN